MHGPQQRFPVVGPHIVHVPGPGQIQIILSSYLDILDQFPRGSREDVLADDVAELPGGVVAAGDAGPVLPDDVGPAVEGGDGLVGPFVLRGGVVADGYDGAFGAAGDEEVVECSVGGGLISMSFQQQLYYSKQTMNDIMALCDVTGRGSHSHEIDRPG